MSTLKAKLLIMGGAICDESDIHNYLISFDNVIDVNYRLLVSVSGDVVKVNISPHAPVTLMYGMHEIDSADVISYAAQFVSAQYVYQMHELINEIIGEDLLITNKEMVG